MTRKMKIVLTVSPVVALVAGVILACVLPGCLMPLIEGKADSQKETVVFIHGLQRSGFSMTRLQKRFAEAGYNTLVCTYRSSTDAHTISTNLFATLDPLMKPAPKVHFVTHSMGGILLRDYLKDGHPANLGRTVMLGPPNRGSELIDIFAGLPGFDPLWGKAGHDLGTGPDSLAVKLPPVDFTCGVIAGDRSITLLSVFIPGRDDGKVSLTNTFVEGISDRIVLHANHMLMPFSDIVGAEAFHYIQTGSFFDPDKPDTP